MSTGPAAKGAREPLDRGHAGSCGLLEVLAPGRCSPLWPTVAALPSSSAQIAWWGYLLLAGAGLPIWPDGRTALHCECPYYGECIPCGSPSPAPCSPGRCRSRRRSQQPGPPTHSHHMARSATQRPGRFLESKSIPSNIKSASPPNQNEDASAPGLSPPPSSSLSVS